MSDFLTKLRTEFEKVPEIETRLVFVDDFYKGKYVSEHGASTVDFINGAWFAYVEKQKEVLHSKEMVINLKSSIADWVSCSVESKNIDFHKLLEILK